MEVARSFAPVVEAKWGDEGLESIFQDKCIHAVAVVLPAQYQVRAPAENKVRINTSLYIISYIKILCVIIQTVLMYLSMGS